MKSICREVFAKTLTFLLVAAILLAFLPTGVITTFAAVAESSDWEAYSVVRSNTVLINGFDALTAGDLQEIINGGKTIDSAYIDNNVVPNSFVNQSIRINGNARDGEPWYGWSCFSTLKNNDGNTGVVNNVFGADNLDEADGIRFWIKVPGSFRDSLHMVIEVGSSTDGESFEMEVLKWPESSENSCYITAFWEMFYYSYNDETIFDHLKTLDYISIKIESCKYTYYVSDLHAIEWDGGIPNGSCGDDTRWSLNENGDLVISGTGDIALAPWVDAPIYYNSRRIKSVTISNGITSIGAGAFGDCFGLKSVTIPDSVTSIGDGAFGNCFGLTSIEIPESVTSIGNDAFCYCTGLTSVTIPDSVTSFGGRVFYGTGYYNDPSNWENEAIYIGKWLIGATTNIASNYTIKDGTVGIAGGTFAGCTGLTSVTIPDSVTSIGDSAFEGCTGLTNVTIPDSVTSIGNKAFGDCTGLTSVTIPDSVTSIGDSAFYFCAGLTSVTIGNSVTSIGNSAFYNCNKLTSVTIPDSVTSIGDYTFRDCTGLTSVTIGNGVTSIGNYAFHDCCKRLERITVAERNPVYHSASNCLIETESRNLILGCQNSIIPTDGSVTSIGDSAFYGCTGLTSITIPDSVTSIGNSAFVNCSGLTSITIPDSMTSIGNSAFEFTGYYNNESNWKDGVLYIGKWLITAKKVTSSNYTIKNETVGIADYAFGSCNRLWSVTIPDSVTRIGYGVFRTCNRLESIFVAESNPVYHSASNCLIETESKTLIAGCNTSVIPADGSVTSIGKSTFMGFTGLTSIEIPDSVTSIGDYAFYGCTGLTSITIPDSVTYIGTYAFDIQKYDYNVDNYLYYPLDVTLCVYINSYAHKYAVDNCFRYEFIRPSRIKVTTWPNKLSYLESKDLLDVTGGVITAYYDNDTSEEISMTADMVSGFDNKRVGVQTLTVTYEGLTATFDVEIIAKTLTDMRITSLPNKRRYIEHKGGLDLSGGKYTLYYNNDTTETLNITADMVSGFDITSIGTQTLTVTYGDFTDTFEVEVVPKSISRIAVTTLPDKTSYSEAKDTFDSTGGIVTIYYDNDTTETVSLGNEMVTGFNNRALGSQTLTVVYRGYMTTFNVTIVARTLVSIVATRLPDKVTYREGEEFDPTGLEVTAYYDNDTEEIITDYGIFGYYSTPGERAVTVTYGGKYYSFGVVVFLNNAKGDPDGDGEITVADALSALRVAAKLAEATPELITYCDVDNDGVVTVADALAILRVAAKLADASSLG